MNPIVKKILPHLTAILIFLGLSVAYFYPQLEGKSVNQSDITQHKGMAKEIQDLKEDTGTTSLWTNSMFGGMPAYQIILVKAGNLFYPINKVLTLSIKEPIGRFFVGMLSFYLLMVCLGVNHWVGIIGAIAFGLTTNSIILYEAGHLTKLRVITYLPIAALGVLLTYRKHYLWGGLIFAFGMGLNIMAGHPQMTYIFFLTLIFMGIAQLINDAKSQQLPHFIKASAILVAAGILGLFANASNLLPTYEYSKDTMRGKPILESVNAPGTKVSSSSETDGLAWDYAMGWSNGTIDLLASFIPGVAGGGSHEKVGDSAPLRKDPNWRRVVQSSQGRAPLYWGALPFTSGPIYMGAIVFFLFLVGLVLIKGPVKWWLGLGTLLTLCLSMGKNMEWFNEFFYNYVPLYNKFRTPNSVLSVTTFLMPLLGFIALNKIVDSKTDKKTILNSLMVAGGISGALCLFFLLLGPSMFDFSTPGDARYVQAGFPIEPLMDSRKALMRSDAFRTLLLFGIAGGLIWAFIKEKIQSNILVLGIGVLVLFDVWSVGKRYLDSSEFAYIPGKAYEAPIPMTTADQEILNKEPHRGAYRVLDLTVSPFKSSSRASYFHSSLGGYHAAKLQRYQDIIDYYLDPGIQQLSQALEADPSITGITNALATQGVMNMLNTKYLLLNPESPPVTNPHALGNAWFVNKVSLVNTPNEEIEAIGRINPAEEVIVHQEFANYASNLSLQKNGSITQTNYDPMHLTYQSSTSSEQMAVFSEIWYGPDKGWKAYIDNQPADFIRVNYFLRGLKVPAGEHKVEFRFEPRTYEIGRILSLICSSLIVFTMLGYTGYKGYHYFQNLPAEEIPKPEKKTRAKSPARTAPKKTTKKKGKRK